MKTFKFDYVGSNKLKACCDVSIIGKTPVVVLHERADNPGMSVTNASEYIATALYVSRLRHFDPASIRWFEHYPDDPQSWDRIEYRIQESTTREGRSVRFTDPNWSPSSLEEIEHA